MPITMKTAAKTTMTRPVHQACSPGCRDHHAARRVAKDVVGRLAEDRARPRAVRQPRRAHDDDLRVAPVGLGDDRGAGAATASQALDDPHAVELADVVRLVEQRVGESLLLGKLGVERLVERHDDHAHGDDRRPPLGGETRRHVHRLDAPARPSTTGTTIVRYSSANAGPIKGGALAVSASGSRSDPPAVDDIADEPGHHPGEPYPARLGVLHDDDEQTRSRWRFRRAQRTAASRSPPSRRLGRARYGILGLRRLHAEPHDRRMGDGERQRRAEGVQRADERRVTRAG